MADRKPPANEPAEQALLGACLMANRAFERCADFLSPEMFASRAHGRIWAAISILIQRGKQADPITLKGLFEADGDLAEVGGYAYLMKLAGSSASPASAADYGRLIRDAWLRRRLAAAGDDISAGACREDLEAPAEAQIEAAEAQLSALAEAAAGGAELAGPQLIEAPAAAALARLRLALDGGGIGGLPSGIAALDAQLGGWHAPDLIICGGRPGMGKTAMASTCAYAAARAGGAVAFFSMEMSAEQLAQRGLAEATGISAKRQRMGPGAWPAIESGDLDALDRAAANLAALQLWVDDRPALTVSQLRARAARLHRWRPLSLIIVDYIQLMRGESGFGRGENRNQELSQITGGLKGLAKELQVPVLALSQLSRAVEGRDDRRPSPADLRDSGAIEQDADIIFFVYREEEYLRRSEPRRKAGQSADEHTEKLADWDALMAQARGKGDILIEKDRHGEPCKIPCRFDGIRSRWADLYQDDGLPEERG